MERVWDTLQKRLPPLLRLEGIRPIEAANRGLSGVYLAQHNARFTVNAAEEGVSLRRGPPRLLLRGSYKCPLVLEVDIIAHVDRRTRSHKAA